MEAIEFQTTLGSDGIIAIPSGINGKVKRGKVRVIVIEEETQIVDDNADPKTIKNYIKYLMANPIKVDKSKPFLTRDEIYDRNL